MTEQHLRPVQGSPTGSAKLYWEGRRHSLTESDAIAIAGITRTDGTLLNAGSNAITQSGVIAVDDGAVS